jgi:hypothetical protein
MRLKAGSILASLHSYIPSQHVFVVDLFVYFNIQKRNVVLERSDKGQPKCQVVTKTRFAPLQADLQLKTALVVSSSCRL